MDVPMGRADTGDWRRVEGVLLQAPGMRRVKGVLLQAPGVRMAAAWAHVAAASDA